MSLESISKKVPKGENLPTIEDREPERREEKRRSQMVKRRKLYEANVDGKQIGLKKIQAKKRGGPTQRVADTSRDSVEQGGESV